MAQNDLTQIKPQAVGGQASPAPPVGAALGQHESRSAEPDRVRVGTITQAQVREIAELELVQLDANDVERASKIIAGTARSMGVHVV